MKVTDHAMVRWLQKVEGFNLAQVKQMMAAHGWRDMRDAEILNYLDQMTGTTREAISAEILAAYRAGERVPVGYLRFRCGSVVFALTGQATGRSIATVYRARPDQM